MPQGDPCPSRARRGRHALASLPAVVIMSLLSIPASAQPSTPAPSSGWQNGPFIQSADGTARLEFGLLAQFDGRFAPGDDAGGLTDTFGVRRLRPIFRGRITEHVEFTFSPDVAGGVLSVQDAYVDTKLTPTFRLRLGKTKVPVAFERLHSEPFVTLMERALPSNIPPNRDVGVLAMGQAVGGRLSYSGGVTNGTRDGANSDLDTNDSKDIVGRVLVRAGAGMSVGVAGSTGTASGASALPSYRTTIFQQTFFSYATGAAADGRLTRAAAYASLHRGPLGAFAEYTRSAVPVSRGDTREAVAHQAWQVNATYVLTGEAATDNGVTPRASFNPAAGAWGAVQVAARYHTLAIDHAAFDLGLAAPAASREARAWSAGLNWYLNRLLQYRVMFERTVFEGGAERPAENVITFRSQVSF